MRGLRGSAAAGAEELPTPVHAKPTPTPRFAPTRGNKGLRPGQTTQGRSARPHPRPGAGSRIGTAPAWPLGAGGQRPGMQYPTRTCVCTRNGQRRALASDCCSEHRGWTAALVSVTYILRLRGTAADLSAPPVNLHLGGCVMTVDNLVNLPQLGWGIGMWSRVLGLPWTMLQLDIKPVQHRGVGCARQASAHT